MSLHRKDWLKLAAMIGLAATGAGAAGVGPLAGMFGSAAGAGAAGVGEAALGGATVGAGGAGTAGMFGAAPGLASSLMTAEATPMITGALAPEALSAGMFGPSAQGSASLAALGGPEYAAAMPKFDFAKAARFNQAMQPQGRQQPMPAAAPAEPPQQQKPGSLVAILNAGMSDQNDPYLEYLKRKRAGGLYGG